MEHDYQNALPTIRLAATITDIAGSDPPTETEEKIEWISNIWKTISADTPTKNGTGTHGTDLPEDTDIFQFFGGISNV